MAGTTDTTVAEAIKTHIYGVAETLDDRRTPMIDYVGVVPSLGGDSVDWKVNSAGNTSSEAFVEGDAPSAAGYQTYYGLTLAKAGYQYRTMVQVTGTALDSCKNGHFDVINRESIKGAMDHWHYVEGLVVTGFTSAIDSGGDYAGQTRATVNTASYEADVTPTLDQMATMWTTLAADPISLDMSRAAMISEITFIDALGDVSVVQTNLNHNVQQGQGIDAGRLAGGDIAYNKSRFTLVPTMTAGTCLITDKENLHLTSFRDFQVDVMAKNDDSVTLALTNVIVPWVFDPRHAGKLT